MEKKKLTIEIGEEQSFDAESYMQTPTTIDGLLQWLSEVKEQGATHIRWMASTTCDGDSYEVTAHAYLERYETDEECLARDAKEKEAERECKERQLKYEKEQYEKLKQKFEGGK